MNILTSHKPSINIPAASPADMSIRIAAKPEPAPQFLVLVPSLELDLTDATRKVWEVAKTSGAHIHFASLYNDPALEPSLRRGLTTLAAMIKTEGVSTSTEVIAGNNWADVVKAHEHGISMIVCFPEPQIRSKPHGLNRIMQLNLPVPLYILTDPATEPQEGSTLIARLLAWIGSIAILLGFFFIQAKIVQVTSDWLNTLLILITTAIEFGLIWLLNASL